MELIKLVQTWDPLPGRKQEYASFIAQEFQPTMKSLGLEIVAGWYVLVGSGPHILVESLAESLDQVEKALKDERLGEMLNRFRNIISQYTSRVFIPTGRVDKDHGQVPQSEGVKFVQGWDILPGQREEYDQFVQEVHLTKMKAIGLEVVAGWQLMLGTGSHIVSEALAQDLSTLGKALDDERYLQMITQMEDLIAGYECQVLVRHRCFLDTLHRIHGQAIRGVAEEEIRPMVGPIVG